MGIFDGAKIGYTDQFLKEEKMLQEVREVIDKDIQDGNIQGIREDIGILLYTREGFFREFDEAIDYVERKGINIKETYNREPLIPAVNPAYTDEAFAEAVFYLKNNFCKERIAYVKELGKARYGQSAPAADEKKPEQAESKKGAGDTDPKSPSHQKRNPLLMAGILAVLVIIVAAIILLTNGQ